MDIETIIVLCMLAVVLVASIILVYKRKGAYLEADEILVDYLTDIVRVMKTAIRTLKVDRNDYPDEESYKRALASYVAGELRIFIENANINATLLEVLTVDVITEFILNSFDMIRDIAGYDKYINSYNKAVKQ